MDTVLCTRVFLLFLERFFSTVRVLYILYSTYVLKVWRNLILDLIYQI